MEKKEKIKNLIHLAIKAKKVSFGQDNSFSLMKRGKVKLILIDKSLSENSVKKVTIAANRYKVKYLFYNGNMGEEIKFGVKIISILDKNFARPIFDMLRGKNGNESS